MTATTATEKRQAIETALVRRADSFTRVLPPTLTFDRFQLAVAAEMQRSPAIVGCTPASIVMAAFDAAKLGLQIDSTLGEAYLIPFRDNRRGVEIAQLVVGYRGYTTLALQSPRVKSIASAVVRDGDAFEYELGTHAGLKHVPRLGGAVDSKLGSDITHAYALAHVGAPGVDATDWVIVVMSRDELEHVRSHAKGGSRPDSPWNQHRPRMYRKCPIRRLATDLPLSDGLRHALSVDGDTERTREDRDRVTALRKQTATELQIADAEVEE